MNKLELLRILYGELVKCHGHLWELVLQCSEAGDNYNALHFATLIFRRDARSVALGGGQLNRYGGTNPYLTDMAYLFYRLGGEARGLSKDKSNWVRFMAHLFKSHEAIKALKLSRNDNLRAVGRHAVEAIGAYDRFHQSGYSVLPSGIDFGDANNLIASTAHYNKRTAMLKALVVRCLRLLNESSAPSP